MPDDYIDDAFEFDTPKKQDNSKFNSTKDEYTDDEYIEDKYIGDEYRSDKIVKNNMEDLSDNSTEVENVFQELLQSEG